MTAKEHPWPSQQNVALCIVQEPSVFRNCARFDLNFTKANINQAFEKNPAEAPGMRRTAFYPMAGLLVPVLAVYNFTETSHLSSPTATAVSVSAYPA